MEAKSKPIRRKDRHGNELSNVSIRIPKIEFEAWQGEAARAGITLTTLLRQAVKDQIERR